MGFKFSVVGQDLECISKPSVVVSDTVAYLSATFRFTPEWTGLDKWAHFIQDEKVYDVHLVDDEIPESDLFTLSNGTWKMYLHGSLYDAEGKTIRRITTDGVSIKVEASGLIDGDPYPSMIGSAGQKNLEFVRDTAEEIRKIKKDMDDGLEKIAETHAEMIAHTDMARTFMLQSGINAQASESAKNGAETILSSITALKQSLESRIQSVEYRIDQCLAKIDSFEQTHGL